MTCIGRRDLSIFISCDLKLDSEEAIGRFAINSDRAGRQAIKRSMQFVCGRAAISHLLVKTPHTTDRLELSYLVG